MWYDDDDDEHYSKNEYVSNKRTYEKKIFVSNTYTRTYRYMTRQRVSLINLLKCSGGNSIIY